MDDKVAEAILSVITSPTRMADRLLLERARQKAREHEVTIEQLLLWLAGQRGVPVYELEVECDECGRPGRLEGDVLTWGTGGCDGPASLDPAGDPAPPGQPLPTVCPSCRGD